ncbi:MAG TPA: FtsX-like permease family protein, partial [Abditibacteriaceae bacterium]
FASLLGQGVQIILAAPRGQKQSFDFQISGFSSQGGRGVEVSTPDRLRIKGWWFNDRELLQKEGYDSVTLRASDVTGAKALVAKLRKEKLNVQSIDAILDVANRIFAAITAMLGLMSSVALFVAFIGIANTMIMSIYERTREIGTLKAMGASRGDIRQMFMLEAGLIGLFGGIAGLALSWVLGRSLDSFAHWMARQRNIPLPDELFLITPALAVQALVFAFLIGIVAGLYPAHRAARLDPRAALRHE